MPKGSIRSMTGFGRGRCTVGSRRVVIEIRAVNHRFLELKQRLPWNDAHVEHQLSLALRGRLERGAVSVSVRDEGGVEGGPEVQVDIPLARAYASALERLREACGLTGGVPLDLVAAQPGVVAVGATVRDSDALWTALDPGVRHALDELVAARAREGDALRADLAARVATLRRLGGEIAALAVGIADDTRKRLEERIARLVVPGELDPSRLAQEVAFLADKADVAEELARLATHLDEFDRQLATGGAVGRRLEFLAQELHREVNTTGSKSQRVEIVQRVVDAKVEVERIREQVQNVE